MSQKPLTATNNAAQRPALIRFVLAVWTLSSIVLLGFLIVLSLSGHLFPIQQVTCVPALCPREAFTQLQTEWKSVFSVSTESARTALEPYPDLTLISLSRRGQNVELLVEKQTSWCITTPSTSYVLVHKNLIEQNCMSKDKTLTFDFEPPKEVLTELNDLGELFTALQAKNSTMKISLEPEWWSISLPSQSVQLLVDPRFPPSVKILSHLEELVTEAKRSEKREIDLRFDYPVLRALK